MFLAINATIYPAISEWSQFGLAGLVIGALFVVLMIIVRWLVSYIDKQSTIHRDERKEWREENIAGRVEYQRSVERSVEALERSISELSQSIRNNQ